MALIFVFMGCDPNRGQTANKPKEKPKSQAELEYEEVFGEPAPEDDGQPKSPQQTGNQAGNNEPLSHQVLAGSWELDMKASVVATLEANDMYVSIESMLAEQKQMIFSDLELKADGTFSCVLRNQPPKVRGSGRWYVEGRKVSLHQSHVGKKQSPDRLDGTLENENLHLIRLNTRHYIYRRAQ